jgi:hypothetical protein
MPKGARRRPARLAEKLCQIRHRLELTDEVLAKNSFYITNAYAKMPWPLFFCPPKINSRPLVISHGGRGLEEPTQLLQRRL